MARWTLTGQAAAVTVVSPVADGTHLVTGSDDVTVRVWNLDTGGLVATFAGGSSIRTCAVASRDSDADHARLTIAAGEASAAVHVLRLEPRADGPAAGPPVSIAATI
jgi:WD40 repeat protein